MWRDWGVSLDFLCCGDIPGSENVTQTHQNRTSVYIREYLYHDSTDPSFPFFLSKGQRLSTSNESYTTQGQNKAPSFFSMRWVSSYNVKQMGRWEEQTERKEIYFTASVKMGGQMLNGDVVLHCYRCWKPPNERNTYLYNIYLSLQRSLRDTQTMLDTCTLTHHQLSWLGIWTCK